MDYQKIKIGKYEIYIDAEKQYGYYEHDVFGEDMGGGLWFENNTLVDYDGLSTLPVEVIKGIQELGFELGLVC